MDAVKSFIKDKQGEINIEIERKSLDGKFANFYFLIDLPNALYNSSAPHRSDLPKNPSTAI